ncbi:hypothetical protein J6590_027038 [Homalodisca vitripennis]|nr:hypothetical protein J6590_027038 [Homalodisca vitripennis]
MVLPCPATLMMTLHFHQSGLRSHTHTHAPARVARRNHSLVFRIFGARNGPVSAPYTAAQYLRTGSTAA